MQTLPFSRRDFLKVSAAGMLGAFLAEAGVGRALAKPRTQGRMTLSGIGLYNEPSFKATKLHAYGLDEVVAVTGEVTGEAGNPYNTKWYAINGEGYTYSGWVQPVESNYQRAEFRYSHRRAIGWERSRFRTASRACSRASGPRMGTVSTSGPRTG